jgi:hypothetical protein
MWGRVHRGLLRPILLFVPFSWDYCIRIGFRRPGCNFGAGAMVCPWLLDLLSRLGVRELFLLMLGCLAPRGSPLLFAIPRVGPKHLCLLPLAQATHPKHAGW